MTPETEVETEQPVELPATFSTAETQEQVQGDAAAAETQSSGDVEIETVDPTGAPAPEPLRLPRSWDSDRADAWAKLDRDTQEYLLDHDKDAQRIIRTAQQEHAERVKVLQERETRADQARQGYETAVSTALQVVQGRALQDFADIRTPADVEMLARTSPERFAQFQAARMQIEDLGRQLVQAQQDGARQKAQKFTEFAEKQDADFRELVPEAADPEKWDELQDGVVNMLVDLGFDEKELAEKWNSDPAFRDARFQKVLYDAYQNRLKEARAKAARPKITPKPLSPGGGQPAQPPANTLAAAAARGDMRTYVQLRAKGAFR
jgi:hypothetical protein